MDTSLNDDAMDWQEDSSLHIIQPASSPWRKRSYNTYTDTNQPYYPDDPYSNHQFTDTLPNHATLATPLVDAEGRPAQFVTDSNGNIVVQAIVEPEPPQPIGYYLPEVLKWIIYGAALLFLNGVQLAGETCNQCGPVAVRVGNSAKRRLVEYTKKAFAPRSPPPPSRRRHRHHGPHRHRTSVLRRVSPTSPGGRTHIPVTPPRTRPMATLQEVALPVDDCVHDYIPSNVKHVRSGAFVTSAEDGHLMSGITHHSYFEPLMSGALEDVEMDEDAQSSVISPSSSYQIPGTFPELPAPTELPASEQPVSEPLANDALAMPQEISTDELTMLEKQSIDELTIPENHSVDESNTPEKQSADEFDTPHSEASNESYIPDVQPTITFPLQQVDSRPRNYKGELLNDWQIKICKEFQAIHPPPRDTRQQVISLPERLQDPNSTGSIEPHRSPLANGFPVTPRQQHRTTTTGLIDSRRSPMASVSDAGASDGTIDLYKSNIGLLHEPNGMISIGLNDLNRSPLDLHGAATEDHQYHPIETSSGLNDLRRSPLDLDRATTEDLHQPNGITSPGSSDSHRSPLTDVPPAMVGVIPSDSHNATPNITHEPPGAATIGSIDSNRSPLVDALPTDRQHEMTTIGSIELPRSSLAEVSLINSPRGTDSIGSIGSTRSPLADVSPIHLRPGTSPNLTIDAPRSPLALSSMGPAAEAVANTYGPGLDISDSTRGATSVSGRSLVRTPSAPMATPPAKSPSIWSFRSLYARVQGKPKKRSPLCERVNDSNIRKAPKTPKKVTWPENGPVTGTKRFIKNEAMSHPSPSSSREDSSILSSVPSNLSPQTSPTTQEEEKDGALPSTHQTTPSNNTNGDRSMSPISSNESNVFDAMSTIQLKDAVHNSDEEYALNSSSSSDSEASIKSVETPTKTTAAGPSTPECHLSPNLEELTISTRRSSLRRREKEDRAQKIAAEEKARKDKEEAEEKARKEKEEAEERARIKAEKEEEERKRTGGRRIPIERVIQSLPAGWDDKVRINMAKGMREQLAMTSVGNPLTRRDFGMVLPQRGAGDDPSGWLNDEIISGYLQAVVDHGHRAMDHPRGAKPRMHAFNPFFYTTLKERGYDSVKRWSSRAKIGGNDLKNVEYVFIPCNPSRSHWTLVAVSPVRKTIEVFDSMHGSSLDKVNTIKTWLRGELGRAYVDSEWTVIEDPAYPGRGKGPVQDNPNDCGVFTVTTAKMLVLGVDPMAVSAEDMPLQRRRVVAELLNGGFSGEFEPHVVFG